MARALPRTLPSGLHGLVLLLLVGGVVQAAPVVPHTEVLPPELPWNGASRSLALPADSADPFITPFEKSGRKASPSYDETFAYLRRLVAAAPELDMVSLGKSGEGRDVFMVVASRGQLFTPAALAASKKPVVLVQGGIHAGEIDGKDAGLMLLRDLTVGGKLNALLDQVELLYVPIFNVDGHERSGPYGRINQRGPEKMGWRTTARNLNLNRDYMKAEAPEMRAMLGAIAAWQPDLYVDVHVTDGIDYQYDVSWGYGGEDGWSPAISRFLSQVLDPPVQQKLEAAGHAPHYLIFSLDSDNPDQGHIKWQNGAPRFSDSYGAARHLPTILVENHSLKSHERRVLGTYVFLQGVLETVGKNAAALEQAIAEDRARRPDPLPLRFDLKAGVPPVVIDFLGVEYRQEKSAASGTKTVFTGVPVAKQIPRLEKVEAVAKAARPKAYLVPPQWPEAIENLAIHGIRTERFEAPRQLEVEMYRLEGAKIAGQSFEGRVGIELASPPRLEKRKETFPAGTIRVPTDQPLGDLAMLLLEPESEDSLLRWGYFLEILSRTEYVEPYVMAPMAEKMLAADPALAAEFAKKLEDEKFAADPQARLQFFYRKTPYFDDRHLLYPVARE
jgi:hypothetical protein